MLKLEYSSEHAQLQNSKDSSQIECSIWFLHQRAISNCRQYCFGLLGLISAVYIYIYIYIYIYHIYKSVVDITGTITITITTRVTTIKSITLIYTATIITMRRRAVAILPTENGHVDVNAKDPYINDVDHDDDNCTCVNRFR